MSESPLKPLTLRQVYGLNPLLPPQDLTSESDKISSFVYVSGNLTIIQSGDEQIILHGHTNNVSAFDISPDKSLIVTGEASSIIVWDVCKLEPITVFDQENYRPIFVKFSNDNTKFATIDKEGQIRVYDIFGSGDANGSRTALAQLDQKCKKWVGGQQHSKLIFHNDSCLMSFGPHSLAFYQIKSEVSEDVVSHRVSMFNNKNLNLADNSLSGSILDAAFYNSSQVGAEENNKEVEVATTMSNGHVVIWSGPNLSKIKYNRSIKLGNENESLTTINILSDIDLIIVGSSSRKIRFYDQNLKLKNWIASKQIVPNIYGQITSISLMHEPNWQPAKFQVASQAKQAETTLDGYEFSTRHLLVTTDYGEVIRITHEGKTNVDSKSSVFSYGKSADLINSFCLHPSQELIALTLQNSKDGRISLELFDYVKNQRVKRIDFGTDENCNQILQNNEVISALAFDPKGVFLIAGTSNGRMLAFDSLTLQLQDKFLLSTVTDRAQELKRVEQIVFDKNGNDYFAMSDASCALTLFKIVFSSGSANAGGEDQTPTNNSKTPVFEYLGRSRCFTDKICSIIFHQNFLMAIGTDRYMSEYDLNQTEYKGEQSMLHPIREPTRLEQTAKPVAGVLHPEIASESNEKFILTVTDQHKLRLFNTKTRLARRTVSAPICGSAISKIRVIPHNSGDLLAFTAGAKIGLILLPTDGNPWGHTSILAHPSGIDNIEISHCGKFLFSLATVTPNDTDNPNFMQNHGCLQCWEISKESLEAQYALAPQGIEPFVSLMENGRVGKVFNDIKTYFYYASLIDQGVHTSKSRQIQEQLPLKFLPDILRACGLYLSEREFEEMVNEVLFWKYGTGESDRFDINAKISLIDVVKLYINYQHVDEYGKKISQEDLLINACKKLQGNDMFHEFVGNLLGLIQQTSEAVDETELADRLACLANIQPVGVEQEWPAGYERDSFAKVHRDLAEALPSSLKEFSDMIFKH